MRYQDIPLCRQQVTGQLLPSQAALGLFQQAVEIHGVVLAFSGGWIKVIRMGIQVCIIRFAELLLSTEAQLELGLV